MRRKKSGNWAKIGAIATIISVLISAFLLFKNTGSFNARITGRNNIVAQGRSTISIVNKKYIPLPVAVQKTQEPIYIKITEPKEGQRIDRIIEIKGTSQNIPTSHNIWVYVFAAGINKYYPTKVIDIKENGDWRVSNIYVGAKEDYNIQFELGALVTDKEGSLYISQHNEGELSVLPPGKRINVLVYRKSR